MGRFRYDSVDGRVGNVVFYSIGKKTFARTAPAKVKQTKGMKACADNFASVTRLGKLIREKLSNVTPHFRKVELMRRINKALFKWQKPKDGSPDYDPENSIIGFEYDLKFKLRKKFKPKIAVVRSEQQIEVTIPAHVPSADILYSGTSEKFRWTIIYINAKLEEKSEIIESSQHRFEVLTGCENVEKNSFSFQVNPVGNLQFIVVALEVMDHSSWTVTRAIGFY